MRRTFGVEGAFKWFLLGLLLITIPVSAWSGQIKNVIMMVPDGTGSAHTTITRWYKGGPLALDQMYVGAVRTYSADSLITDSAPAATAFATGYKAEDKMISVLPEKVDIPGVPKTPEELRYKPAATVLEGAKLYGKSVGLVATSNIQHATPAAFSAHWHDRSDYDEISEQQVYLDLDVVFGGGKKYLLPAAQKGTRKDGENLIEVLKARGYAFVETREEMLRTNAPKVWGLFADHDLAYEFDRRKFFPGEQPSLAEMTQKAIELLSRNPKGFFLFVEGSKVDWASHANDPIGVISDVLAFDEAVGVALDFAKKKGETLVLAFTDHGNGGMSLGSKASDKTYSKLPLKALVEPLKKAVLTGAGVEKALTGDLSESNIRNILAKYYGMDDLTSDEVAQIQKYTKGRMNYVIGPMISKRSVIGWTTAGHTGEDVFLYMYGLERPMGVMENTEIARFCALYLGVDLAVVDARLFREAEKAFKELGATLKIDRTDETNPVLVVEKGQAMARLPFNKDLMKVQLKRDSDVIERDYEMEGITIFAPKTGKVYVPEHSLLIFKSFLSFQ